MPQSIEFDAGQAATTAAPAARNLLLVVWQRKSLVALGVAVGLVIATLYYARTTPVYQSNAQVLVVKKRSAELVPVAGGNAGMTVMDDYLATHLVLLRSPLVVERAVKKRDLQTLPSLAGTDPVGAIVASLGASRDKDATGSGSNNIINLSYKGTVAEDCGTILTAVIDSYKDFLDETYRNFSDDTLELITRGRDGLLKDLKAKDEAYNSFREKSPLIWKGKDGLTTQQERVNGIEAKRSALLIRRADLRDRLKEFEEAVKAGRPRAELLAMATTRAEKEKPPEQDPVELQLLPLLLQEQQLLENYSNGHPDVIGVRKRIEFLRKYTRPATSSRTDGLPADPVERYAMTLRRDLREVELEQESLKKLLEAEQQEARSLAGYERQDESFRNDIMRTQQLYEGLIKRLQEVGLARDGGGFDARPLARPGPGYKIAPSALQVFLGGLMMGLMAGIGLAYLAELADKGFRTPEEIRRRLGLPVIGHIPLLTPDPESLEKVKTGRPTVDPYLIAYHRPKSVDAEAYRAVRTALYFSTQGAGHTVVQVTSPDMGDGKSTLISNLAVSVAQSGKRTILIDADLRRPRLHRAFGMTAPTGLAAVIAGTVGWRDAVQPTPVPNLSILPCGPLPPNPAELLTSPRFPELLAEIRAEYDFVLVDTPPLLAVTDPCVVTPRVDGVVLTIRLTKKSGPQAERAREILTTLGANVLGVVVNGVTRKEGSGRYGGGQYEYSYAANEYTESADAQEESYYETGEDGAPQPPRPSAGGTGLRAGRSGLFGWLLSLWA